ncbi:MAG: hypothetical protein AAGU21_19270 [Solidesulfovibrio sp.]
MKTRMRLVSLALAALLGIAGLAKAPLRPSGNSHGSPLHPIP